MVLTKRKVAERLVSDYAIRFHISVYKLLKKYCEKVISFPSENAVTELAHHFAFILACSATDNTDRFDGVAILISV